MKLIEITLADGSVFEVPRISTFAAPEGMVEKIRFLEDQVQGMSISQLQRKMTREEVRIERLTKMVGRCEDFIKHEGTPLDKQEEYMKKIETYENDIEKCQDRLDGIYDEIIVTDKNIRAYAVDVASWLLAKTGREDANVNELVTGTIAIDIVRAGFGYKPTTEGEQEANDSSSPLTLTDKKSNGTDG